MKTLYRIVVIWFVFASISEHSAAQNNQSDWNVPPPLAPANTAKAGTANGKSTNGKSVVLTLTNIPAVSLSATPAAQLPALAAVSSTPPVVSAPDQPAVSGVLLGLPEIPMPSAPLEPNMPQQTLHDAIIPSNIDLPLPAEPDLPPFPAEPKSSGQIQSLKTFLPLMPGLVSLPAPSLPANAIFSSWSIPGIPESLPVKLSVTAETQGIKPRSKGNSPR